MSKSDVPGDWIQDLFPPTFTASVADMRNEEPIKSKIKKATSFDPEAIQRVYERVRLMTILDEELKQQTRDREIEELTSKCTGVEIAHKETTPAEQSIDLDDSCVWDSGELATLRKVYKSAKWKIKDLEVEVQQSDRKCSILEEKNMQLKERLEEKEHNLNDAKKANQRFQIQCANLKEQYNFSCSKLDAVTEMWKEINEEKGVMLKELQELRVRVDQERLSRERLELKVEESDKVVTRERELARENAKFKYEKQCSDLEQDLTVATDTLSKEKHAHVISKKALDSLRKHFASLPLRDIVPENAVFEDQVKNIDYFSL